MRLAALILVALPLSIPGLASAQVDEGSGFEPPNPTFSTAVRFAENAWLFGAYPEVIDALRPRLFPTPPEDAELDQLLTAYELLGASQFVQFGEAEAEEALHALLRLEPDYEMDPLFYPPSLLGYLDDLRVRYRTELDAIREARREQEPEQGGQLRFVERRVEEQSLFVSILPFGIGHFANDETEWGIFYLVSELALGATSMAMFLANRADMTDDGFFPDADVARDRQAIMVGTGIAFYSLVGANVVHGALIHEDVVQTSYGILDEPPEDFLAPQNRAPFWLGLRFRF